MKAVLTYTSKTGTVTLLSGSLEYVDACVSTFYNYDDLAYDSECWSLIKSVFDGELTDSTFHLSVYRYDGTREELPLIFNDKEPIYITTNHYEGKVSEIEKSRKLLFSSKDKKFMKKFVSNDILSETANFKINISDEEAKYICVNNIDLPVLSTSNGKKSVFAIDLFKSSLEQKRLGRLRDLFEASIDMWSENMQKNDDEDLYYYCRSLRLMYLEYKSYTTSKEVTHGLELQKNLKKC